MLLYCDGFDDYGSVWERYDSVIYDGAGSVCISNSIVPVTPRTGKCLINDDERFSFSQNRFVGKNIPGTATLIVGFAYFNNPAGRIPGDTGIVGFWDGATLQVDLAITNTGQFYFTRNGTQLGTPTSANFTFNAWHYIEVQVTINNTTGVCILKVDGIQYINLTSQNTRATANNQASMVSLGFSRFPSSGQVTSQYHAWDDFYICDTTGALNNTFLGDVAVKTNVPTAVGTLSQYTQNTTAWAASTVMWIGRRIKDSNGNIQEVTACTSDIKTGTLAPTWNVSTGGTTTDNHVTWTNRGPDSQVLEVNEVPVMGIQDWLASKPIPLGYAFIDRNLNIQVCTTPGTTSTGGGGTISWNQTIGGTTTDSTATWTCQGTLASFEDLYISDSTVTHQSRFTYPSITATSVFAAVVNMRARKDDSAPRAIRGVAKSGGTTGTSPTDLYLSNTYQFQQGIFETDPNTSAAWTAANLNAAELGIETTV